MSNKDESKGQAKYGVLIDWSDIQSLEGRLLTHVDATYADKEQREAQKSLVRMTVREWMRGLENEWEPFANLKVVAYFEDDNSAVVQKVESLTAEKWKSEGILPNSPR